MVKVKICGVTSKSDAVMCAEVGADFVGCIVRVPGSPRSITLERACELLSALPSKAKGVVVLANPTLGQAAKAAEAVKPWGIQLHGNESRGFVKALREAVGCKVIKAVPVRDERSIEEALGYARICDAILLETPTSTLGGSGKVHDWRLSARIAELARCKVFLAGGLNPENAARAREEVSPYCLDSSSGVERSPGVKDREKVESFIKAAKGL